MVSVSESILRGGRILPDELEGVVRSQPLAWPAIVAGENYAELGRAAGGLQDRSDTELTVGTSPWFSTRYQPSDGSLNVGGNPGTAGEGAGEYDTRDGGAGPLGDVARMLQQLVDFLPVALVVAVALGIIVALGQLFTFNFNVGGD